MLYSNMIISLQVYLITEIGVTPHNLRQGFNAPSLDHAYQSVIQDLVRIVHSQASYINSAHIRNRKDDDMILGSGMNPSTLFENISAALMN